MTTFLASNSITVVITLINQIIRRVTIDLVMTIGYDTHSEQVTAITNGVFAAQFFNTAILVLLVYANFAEFGWELFKGPFYDFTPQWYAVVGYQIVQTMILNALMPLVTETVPILIGWLAQRHDQGWTLDEQQRLYKTKTTQIYQYLDLYSGPTFIIHFKYSVILNVTYVTMFYGAGLPILFPIATLSYFIFYCAERYGLAYTYQMPPAMDDMLTKNALSLLSFSPLLFLINGYWMLSNQQIFDTVVNRISDQGDRMQTSHNFGTLVQLNQATPMVFIALPLLAIILGYGFFYPLLEKWGYTISANTISVDENLPNFFQAVKLSDADWIVHENKNLRENYGFSMVAPEVEARLDNWEATKRPIRGLAWYNILANPSYSSLFNYIEVNVPSREDLIVDGDSDEDNDCEQSDMVQVLLNLAFAPRAVVQDFEFGPGISKSFKAAMEKRRDTKIN